MDRAQACRGTSASDIHRSLMCAHGWSSTCTRHLLPYVVYDRAHRQSLLGNPEGFWDKCHMSLSGMSVLHWTVVPHLLTRHRRRVRQYIRPRGFQWGDSSPLLLPCIRFRDLAVHTIIAATVRDFLHALYSTSSLTLSIRSFRRQRSCPQVAMHAWNLRRCNAPFRTVRDRVGLSWSPRSEFGCRTCVFGADRCNPCRVGSTNR